MSYIIVVEKHADLMWIAYKYPLPLSSPLRFFFNANVTSLLIIGDSLIRSFVLSEWVVDEATDAKRNSIKNKNQKLYLLDPTTTTTKINEIFEPPIINNNILPVRRWLAVLLLSTIELALVAGIVASSSLN